MASAIQPRLIKVYLLGNLHLDIGGEIVPFPEGKTQNLLAYLLLTPRVAHRREILAEQFWPDAEPGRQRRNLSAALYRLQHVLGKGWLNTNQETIALANTANVWVDAWEFERLIQAGEAESWQAAIQLYQGDLLPALYEDWILPHRENLRQQYLACLLKLGETHEANQQWDTSLAYYQQLLHADPLREEAGRGVMRCLAGLGRFAEALNAFANLQSALADTIGVKPGIETRLLVDQLQSAWDLSQQASIQPAAPPFVGRFAERTRLLALLDQARQGHGSLAVVLGEAGIGKTRLLEELAQAAGWRGWRVVWGGAAEHKIPAAYDPLAQALQQALPPVRFEQLARGVTAASLALVAVQVLGQPVLGQSAPIPLPGAANLERLAHALASVLDGLQRISPHLILLDDVQWADPAIWPLLDHLRASLGGIKVVIVLAGRSDEILLQPESWNMLQHWDRENAPLLHLAGFGRHDLRELAAPWHLQNEQLERLAAASGGNPLFALELLQTANLETHLQENPSLGELALQKLATTSAEAQYALQIASVIGYRFGYRPWEAVLTAENISGEKIPALAGELERAGLLHLEQDGYRFAHDTLRTAIYTHIPAPQRRQFHLQTLTFLKRMVSASTLELLFHARQAQAGPSIAHYALQAGEQALASFHFAAAAGYFSQSLETLALDNLAQRYQALLGRARAHDVLADRPAQYADLLALQTLAERLGERHQAEVFRYLANYFWISSDYPQAFEIGQRGLALAAQLGERDMQAAILETLGKASRDLGDYAQARTWLAKALENYQAFGNRRGAAIVLNLLGIVAQRQGNLAQAETQGSQAVQIFRELGDIYNEARALSNLGVAYWMLGELTQAQEAFEAALSINQQIGDRRAELASLSNLASLGGIRGDLECSLGLLDQALALARQTGDRDFLATLQLNRGITLYSLGHLAAAQVSMDEALAVNRSLGRRRGEGYVQYNRGKLLTDLGDYTAALTAFEESIQIRRELGEQKNLLSTQAALAQLHVTRNALAPAQGLLREVWVGFDSHKDDPEFRQEAHLAAFEVFQAVGDDAQAQEHLIESEAAMLENAATLPEGDRQRFLDATPLNRETRAALVGASRRIEVRLARADAPLGKELSPDDFVFIQWTTSAPGDRRIRPEAARRQHVLHRLLVEAEAQNAAPTDDDLAQALGVSRRTILRDMEVLQAQGVAIKTRQRGFDQP